MRAVLQRVRKASVEIEGNIKASIDAGFLVLLGVAEGDETSDADWLAKKIAGMRVFSDAAGLMNLDLKATDGSVLAISQFTLLADYKKGNRPSFIRAAKPDVAQPLYEYFVQQLTALLGKQVETGVFGADMKVALVNDGPVTIVMDSRNPD